MLWAFPAGTKLGPTVAGTGGEHNHSAYPRTKIAEGLSQAWKGAQSIPNGSIRHPSEACAHLWASRHVLTQLSVSVSDNTRSTVVKRFDTSQCITDCIRHNLCTPFPPCRFDPLVANVTAGKRPLRLEPEWAALSVPCWSQTRPACESTWGCY